MSSESLALPSVKKVAQLYAKEGSVPSPFGPKPKNPVPSSFKKPDQPATRPFRLPNHTKSQIEDSKKEDQEKEKKKKEIEEKIKLEEEKKKQEEIEKKKQQEEIERKEQEMKKKQEEIEKKKQQQEEEIKKKQEEISKNHPKSPRPLPAIEQNGKLVTNRTKRSATTVEQIPNPSLIDWKVEFDKEKEAHKKTIQNLEEEKKHNNELKTKNQELEEKIIKLNERIQSLQQDIIEKSQELEESKSKKSKKKIPSFENISSALPIFDMKHKVGTMKKGSLRELRPAVSMPDLGNLDPFDEIFPNSCSITVKATELTYVTTIPLNMKIKDLLSKLRCKFPGDTSNYCLYMFKTKKRSSFQPLDEDRTVDSYKELLDPKKAVLYFQAETDPVPGDTKKVTKKKKPSDTSRKGFENAVKTLDIITLHALFEYDSEKTKNQLISFNEEGNTFLHSCILSQNMAIIEAALKYWQKLGLSLNIKDKNGWSILHTAFYSYSTGSNIEETILRLLLETPGLDTDAENDDGNIPLHYFCQKNASANCQEIGQILISKAPFTVNKKNSFGETPLHKAMWNSSTKVLMVKLLIKNGANVNFATNLDETALHYAVRFERKDLVKLLLHAGADIRARESKEQKTPYDLAVQSKQEELANILKKVQDLLAFCQDLKLEEHFLDFVKNDIFLENLVDKSEKDIESLLLKAGVTAFGVRLRIKKACGNELKRRISQVNSPGRKNSRDGSLFLAFQQIKSPIISHSDLEFTKELGTGSYGKVFKGLYKGNKVAIKVLKVDHKKAQEEFRKECEVLSVIESPNVVRFFGACLKPKICVVIEYCKNRSLFNLMKKPNFEINWETGIQFALGIANGVKCLHEWNPPLFHRDLKSENILVTENLEVKVSDMGLARFNIEKNDSTLGKLCGTYAYLAPELFFGEKFTEKCDIYSLGILFWEIGARVANQKYQAPYEEYPTIKIDFQIAIQAAENNLRPTVPESFPTPYATLVRSCFDRNPAVRPSIDSVYQQLLQFQSIFQKK